MSDEVSTGAVEVDMGIDPFDEVVETGDFDEVDQGDSQEDSGDSEVDSDPVDESSDESVGENAEQDDEVVVEDDAEESDQEEAEESEEGEEEQSEESEESEEGEEVSLEARLDELSKSLEDGSYKVEIDGEEYTLQDLKNDRIGQKEISRRFTEIDIEKKQLAADTEEINGYINEFAGKLRDGDSVGAMQYFGEFAGVPPFMIKEQLIAALRPEIIRREQMTDVEVQNEFLHNKNEYLEQERETESQRREQEQADKELSNHISELREANNIDEQEWNEALEELRKTEKEEDLTPENIAATIKESRLYGTADQVVQNFGQEIPNADKYVEQLVDVQKKYPDFTEEDLQEVLKGALDMVKQNSVKEKLVKKVETKKVNTKKVNIKPSSSEEIDPELEDWL